MSKCLLLSKSIWIIRILIFEPFASHNEQEDEIIIAFLESPDQLDFPITAFSINEVKTVISTLNAKKAPGYDLITAKILKELPITGLKFITQLFNAVLRHSPKFPKVMESSRNYFNSKTW